MGYWIQSSRYEGKCSECECDILPGDRIFYEPSDTGRVETFCAPCGDDTDDKGRIDYDDDDDLQLEVD